MFGEELLNINFTMQKQAIEIQSTADNCNQMMDLANSLLAMKSLIAQSKQRQSSGPIQAGTSNNSTKEFREKWNEGNLDINSWEGTKCHNDDDVSIRASK